MPGFFHVFFLRRTLKQKSSLFYDIYSCHVTLHTSDMLVNLWQPLNLPVNVELKFALFFQQWEQLLLRLPDSHAFGKHRVHKELAGLQNTRNKIINIFNCQSLAKVAEQGVSLPLIHSLVAGTPSPCIHPFSELYLGESLSTESADRSMLFSPFQSQQKLTSPRKCSTGADLVVVRE